MAAKNQHPQVRAARQARHEANQAADAAWKVWAQARIERDPCNPADDVKVNEAEAAWNVASRRQVEAGQAVWAARMKFEGAGI